MTPAESSPSTSRSSQQFAWPVALAWIALLTAIQSALAQSPQPSVLQQPSGVIVAVPSDSSYSQRSGLRLEVDTRWPFSFGYRPVRVRVTSSQPTQREHRITFRLHVAAWDWHYLDVSQSFDMPAGATEATAVVRCPQLQSEGRYWWEVLVDGVRERELCFSEAASWNSHASGNANATNSAIKFLIVGPPSKSHRLTGAGIEAFVTVTFAIPELPTKWIDYSAVDVVVLTPDDLEELARSRPDALAALVRWLRAGGQLWVHSVGQQWQRLADVERHLQLTPGSTDGRADSDVPAPWQPIELGAVSRFQRFTVQHVPTGTVRVIRDPEIIARIKDNPDYLIADQFAAGSPAPSSASGTEPLGDSAQWYVEREMNLGRVRAFRGPWDPIGFSISWQMLGAGTFFGERPPATPLSAAVETTRNWPSRHGMRPDLANEDFANLLVPGVGLAPVNEFRLLITLFVLAIGPLSYWILLRANRLYLILFTVPLTALALTSALFAYAFLSDGLSTNVRVRSYTQLDQSTGEAVCWSRLSYYAGLAPGRGLTLPDDVAVYPILPGWNESGDSGPYKVTRKVEWAKDEQQLTSGWVRSRVPVQLLTVRARKSPHRLHLEAAGDKLRATNSLGTPIKFVAAVDPAGNIFTGENIGADESAELRPSTVVDALRVLRELVLTNEPEAPVALAESEDRKERSRGRRRRTFQQGGDVEYSLERLSENLQSDAIGSLVITADNPSLNVPNGSFIAVTETGPEVELGISAAEELGSFHILVGSW